MTPGRPRRRRRCHHLPRCECRARFRMGAMPPEYGPSRAKGGLKRSKAAEGAWLSVARMNERLLWRGGTHVSGRLGNTSQHRGGGMVSIGSILLMPHRA
eukprot:5002777-Pleurochrysis_carterae.AAC.1